MSKKLSTLVLLAGTFLVGAVSAGTALSTGGNTVATFGNSGYTTDAATMQRFASESAAHGVSSAGASVNSAGRDWDWNASGTQLPVEAALVNVEVFGRR